MSERKYRKPSPALQARIDAHGEWLQTDGRLGKQFVSTADLKGLDLRGVNLEGANLSIADLYRTNLSGANLRGADFTLSRLVEADLRNADFRQATLILACLKGADISGARFDEAETAMAVWPTASPKSLSEKNRKAAVVPIDAYPRKRTFEPPL
jgi:uncharacterized protein YjbI with pentapeptide repeats